MGTVQSRADSLGREVPPGMNPRMAPISGYLEVVGIASKAARMAEVMRVCQPEPGLLQREDTSLGQSSSTAAHALSSEHAQTFLENPSVTLPLTLLLLFA